MDQTSKVVNVVLLRNVILSQFGDDCESIPVDALASIGIRVIPNHTYHTVYGDLIAALEGVECAYFDDNGKWKRLSNAKLIIPRWDQVCLVPHVLTIFLNLCKSLTNYGKLDLSGKEKINKNKSYFKSSLRKT